MIKKNKDKGNLLLFQHGVLDDCTEFAKMVKELKKDEKFIDGGLITSRVKINSKWNSKPSTSLNYKAYRFFKNLKESHAVKRRTFNPAQVLLSSDFEELLNKYVEKELLNTMSLKEKIKVLTEAGYYVMFRTEFLNSNASQIKQENELSRFVKVTSFDSDKVILIGHSQGGLVSMGFAISNPQKVKKLITIATPFEPNNIAKLSKSFLGDLLRGNEPGLHDIAGFTDVLKKTRVKWNLLKIYEQVDTHIIACNPLPGMLKNGHDGMVSFRSQLGGAEGSQYEFKGLKKHIFTNSRGNYINQGLLLLHSGQTDNPRIINKIKELVLEDTKMELTKEASKDGSGLLNLN